MTPDVDPRVTVTEVGESVFLSFAPGQELQQPATSLVTTGTLGKARIPELRYENPDGTPLAIDKDFFGKLRNPANPLAGPFAEPLHGDASIEVWK